jgi:hypothetical protein
MYVGMPSNIPKMGKGGFKNHAKNMGWFSRLSYRVKLSRQ